jgi:tetratricopeptide (TPR) repeat protein
MCLAETGRFPEAGEHGHRALELAEDEPFNRVVAYLGLGRVHLEGGDLATAEVALEQAFDLCRRTNNLLYLVQVTGALGYVRALRGDATEGLSLLEAAVAQAHSRRQTVLASTLAWHAEALLLVGRSDEARSTAERAHGLARNRGERAHEARALHLMGKLALKREPPQFADGERDLRGGLQAAAALGMRPLVAHCHLGLGKLYRRTGKQDQAREQLRTAMTLYREMDMRFWLEQVEAEMQQLG